VTGVAADPKEIRRFQSDLRRFNSELDVITKKLQAHLRTLGTSWHDPEYRKFESMMGDVLKAFNRYLNEANAYTKHLDQKAAPLETYQGNNRR
jgi:hypothetical protein